MDGMITSISPPTLDYGAIASRLWHPTPRLKYFVPTEEKIVEWGEHLLFDPLHVSEESMDATTIREKIDWMLSGITLNLVYEMGDFGGMICFYEIVPGHKCGLTWQLWDTDLWGPGFVKEGRKVCAMVMDEFKLIRIGSQTADPRVVKLTKMVGFEVEGCQRKIFKQNGKLYDSTMLGMVKEK